MLVKKSPDQVQYKQKYKLCVLVSFYVKEEPGVWFIECAGLFA